MDLASPSLSLRRANHVIGGIRVPVVECGRSEVEEAIVFVHGSPGAAAEWIPLMLLLQNVGRCVALDMPGFGKAEKPSWFDYSSGGGGRFLEDVLNHLGIRQAHLVLHDFGGPWGFSWAARNPASCKSMVLMSVGVMLRFRWHLFAKLSTVWPVGELMMAATSLQPIFRKVVQQGNPKPLPAAALDRIREDWDWGTRRATLALYRSMTDVADEAEHFAAALSQWEGKALIIWGAEDPFVDWARIQPEIFRDASVHLIPDSGHWPFLDDLDAVAELVVPFLTVIGEER